MSLSTLADACSPMSSNIAQKDLVGHKGQYPIYGASGLIGFVNFYKQEQQYIAVVKDGAGIGRVFSLPPYSSVIGTMQYLLPKDSIDVNYLYYAVQFMHLEKYYTGSTIPHIYFKDYKHEPLNIPSRDKQQEISSILILVDKAIDTLHAQITHLEELVKSRFIELFGDPHHSTLYPYRKVKDFTEVRSGGTPSRKLESYWKGGDVRWVKTTELRNNEIYDTEEKITTEAVEHSSAKIVPQDTILIAMYGQGKTRGMTAYLKVESTTNQACACILPAEGINQKYLWHFFILSYEELRNLAQGAGQPNLTGDMIKNFSVLMPPLALQNEFAAFVEQADKSKLVIQELLEKHDLLKEALMQKYFG